MMNHSMCDAMIPELSKQIHKENQIQNNFLLKELLYFFITVMSRPTYVFLN